MYDTGYIQHHVTSGFITIWSGDRELPAFWAHPVSGGAFPGLIVLHGQRGLTTHMRANVRRLAEAGFYVVAPNLIENQTSDDPLQPRQAQMPNVAQSGPMHTDAALEVLRTHNRCNGKIGIVGWETGAELALDATLRQDMIRATVLFAGRPENQLAVIQPSATHVLVFYGDSDPDMLPASLNRLSQALFDMLPNAQLIVYPNIANGFADAESPFYNEAFAYLAWQRTIEFLQTHLGAAQAT